MTLKHQDDWEVNEARMALSPDKRTDEWLVRQHGYYWTEFDAELEAGRPGNRPFARMLAIEAELDVRGIPVPEKKAIPRAPNLHGLRESAFEVV